MGSLTYMTKTSRQLTEAAQRIEKLSPSIKRTNVSLSMPLPDKITLLTRSHKHPFSSNGTFNIHERFILCICLQGKGSLWVDTAHYTLAAGETLMIFPWQAHARFPVFEPVLWQLISFEMNNYSAFSEMKNQCYKMSKISFKYLLDIQNEFEACFNSGGKQPSQIAYQLGMLLCDLKKKQVIEKKEKYISAKNDRHSTIITAICKDIYENNISNFDIRATARQHGISLSHLRAVFKKRVGMSIGTFIIKTQMTIANSLLLHSKFNVTEIAEKCGFGSLYSFSRAFKNKHGLSPSVFRNNKRKN